MDLTLHNLPAHVLEDLRRAARLNGRSVNDEAIARLRGRDPDDGVELDEAGVAALLAEIRETRERDRAARPSVEQVLAEIDEMQARYALPELTLEFLEQAKNEGRA